MRMIDADALKTKYAKWYNVYSSEKSIHAVTTAEIDWMPTIGGWISVKDRLPENQEPVIVYVPPHDDDCIGYVGMAYYTRFGEGFWGGTDGNLYGKIGIIHPPTHWMPLPEPPKEVSGDA